MAVSETIAPNYLQHKSAYPGIFGWIFSTDHKRIGILYLISIFTFFFIAVFIGFLMRIELIAPGETIVDLIYKALVYVFPSTQGKLSPPKIYNAMFTLHGVIMIFLFVIPGIPAIFGNFFLPLQLGAKDVAFPRLNLLTWWLFMAGAFLAVLALFTAGGPPDTGWTFYAPYSIKTGANTTLAVFAAFVLGLSSIFTGINFVTTIHRLRAPGMGWFRMPLFAWGLYATAWIQVLATPVIGITLLLIILERLAGIGIFDPARGGDPILYQHLFWIYSHPAVYIMILPGMGVVSEIIPTFSRKHIFGYKAIAFSSMAIAFLGYLVWGHHMFTSGISDIARIIFSFLTFLVAVPTSIKIFNWLATMYKGSIEIRPPLLYALSFIVLFSIGGLTGLMNGTLSVDIHLHDTYFVVGHFHYTMFGGLGFALFAALHYWYPKMFGKMYPEKTANIAWGILFIGFNLLYFPMLILGYMGNPRRYFDYLPKFTNLQVLSTVGSWILIFGLFLMIGNLIYGLFKGEKAPENPWGAATLEWTVSSPPPAENFAEIPHVTTDPYDYKGVSA